MTERSANTFSTPIACPSLAGRSLSIQRLALASCHECRQQERAQDLADLRQSRGSLDPVAVQEPLPLHLLGFIFAEFAESFRNTLGKRCLAPLTVAATARASVWPSKEKRLHRNQMSK